MSAAAVNKNNGKSFGINGSSNPLYKIGQRPDFGKMTPNTALEAIPILMRESKVRLDSIFESVRPCWEDLFVKIPEAIDDLTAAWQMTEHFLSVMNSEPWRKTEEKFLPGITELFIAYLQDARGFNAMVKLRESEAFSKLDPVRAKVVSDAILAAELSGARLSKENRELFNKTILENDSLACKFRNNVIDSAKRTAVVLRGAAEQDGLPPSLTENPLVSNKNIRGETTLRIPVAGDNYVIFMSFAENRGARKRMYEKHLSIAGHGKFDNTQMMENIRENRTSVASLLGYGNFAEMTLSRRMLKSPAEVFAFLEDIRKTAAPKAEADLAELTDFARSKGFSPRGGFRPWDTAYWARRLAEDRFGFSSESLRCYFVLDRVLSGLFSLFNHITGHTVQKFPVSPSVWHKDVRTYRIVRDCDGEEIGSLYIDPFARAGLKNDGAWMNPLRKYERKSDGTLSQPLAVVACNILKPANDEPVRLTFRNVKTLFHEFGHAMQQLLSAQEVGEVSGVDGLEWDAVEIASEFMEYWITRPEVINAVSGGPGTEPLPEKFHENIVAFNKFRTGWATMRQAELAWIDMVLHSEFPSDRFRTFGDVTKAAAEKFSLMPYRGRDKFLCSFSHIFAGGYAAGYYSYLWSDALAADMYSAFDGLIPGKSAAFAEMGAKYTNAFLSRGSSRPTMDSFVAFRGRKPDVGKYPGIHAQ